MVIERTGLDRRESDMVMRVDEAGQQHVIRIFRDNPGTVCDVYHRQNAVDPDSPQTERRIGQELCLSRLIKTPSGPARR